jgi:hypothetical protein
MNPKILLNFFSLILLTFASNLCAATQIDITPFYFSNYSNNFSSKFRFIFDLEIHDKETIYNGTILVNINNGKPINLFGKDWISVLYESETIANNEKVSLKMMDLYDLKTKNIAFTIDLNDDEITKYDWLKQPKLMKPGESVTVGKSIKRSTDKKIISSSEISYRLSVIPQGFEFCTIDKEIHLASKDNSVISDCDLFDKQKKLIGNRLEIKTNNRLTLKGAGKVEIESR